MNIWQVLVMSVVEGVSEFLPISSTGHLILASKLLGVSQTEFVKSFEIVIQLGAILAIVVLYFARVIVNFAIWKRIILAFMPTAVVGLLLYKVIKNVLLGNLMVDVWALLIGGILIIVLEMLLKKRGPEGEKMEKLSSVKAVLIGLIQSISIIPGVSRAGATIFGGMGVGLSRREATEFSFLLAVPTMFAATSLDLVKTRFEFTSSEYFLMLVGFLGAFVTAILTVRWLLGYVSKHSFIPFGIYRILVALLFLFIFR